MSDNIIMESLQKFLQDNVSSKIKLQLPNDEDSQTYSLVNPSVHIGWIPPVLHEGWDTTQQVPNIPCILVGHDDGHDDGNDARLNIRLSFVVFSDGSHGADNVFIPDFKGYKDLVNFIDLTKQEIVRATVINNVTSIDKPIKWGMYKDQPIPYWYGWITFPATCPVLEYVPTISERYL